MLSTYARKAERVSSQVNREVRTVFSVRHRDKMDQFVRAQTISSLRDCRICLATIDINSACNFNCPQCIDRDTARKQDLPSEMPWSLLRSTIEGLKEVSCSGLELMGGETTLYSRYDDLLLLVAKIGLPIRVVTNGSRIQLHLELLSRAMSVPGASLRISVNGDFTSYSKVTGLPDGPKVLARVLENIGCLRRNGVRTGVSFVVFRENAATLASTARLVKEARADSFLVLPGRDPLTREVIDLKTASEVLNGQCEEAKQLEDYDFRVVLPQTLKDRRFQPKTYGICPTAFLKPLIGVDGEVYPCTYMRGKPEFSIAHLSESYSFLDFWSSEERILKLLKIDPSRICNGIVCTRHTLNTTLCALRQCAAAPGGDLTSLLKSTDSSLWF